MNIEKYEDELYLDDEDYHVTMVASSEDIMKPDELLEKELVLEEDDIQEAFPKKRSSRKRTSTRTLSHVRY